jgi:hypothetical protein
LAWLTDVLERVILGRTKAKELAQLPLWAWKAERVAVAGEVKRRLPTTRACSSEA